MTTARLCSQHTCNNKWQAADDDTDRARRVQVLCSPNKVKSCITVIQPCLLLNTFLPEQSRTVKGRHRQRSSTRCTAASTSAPVTTRSSFLSAAVEKLFNFPPIYAAAVKQVHLVCFSLQTYVFSLKASDVNASACCIHCAVFEQSLVHLCSIGLHLASGFCCCMYHRLVHYQFMHHH